MVDADVLAGAVDNMAALNRPASQAMQRVGVNAATDITGFGLLGHLKSMVKGSGVSAEINLSAVPVLPGTRDLLERGVAPGGTHRNVSSVNDAVNWHADLTGQRPHAALRRANLRRTAHVSPRQPRPTP